MNSNEKPEISYAALWKAIIRPPKDKYSEDLLGDNIFSFKSKTYVRKDYDLITKRGFIMKTSFIEPDDHSRVLSI